MPREVLNRPRRRTAHGEMRTERVPKDMHPRPHTREACGDQRQLFLPVAEDGIGRFMGDGGSV